MRVVVELLPASAADALILADWQEKWGMAEVDGGLELSADSGLAALLDLRRRCYDRGIVVNATFPDTH